jgi:hypothetical protein
MIPGSPYEAGPAEVCQESASQAFSRSCGAGATSRTNNPYGRQPDQIAESLAYKESVEPLLRRGATIEIDTSPPLDDVVAAVLDHVTAERRA